MGIAHYVFDFERLEVYKIALELTNEIFRITLKFKKEIQYSLGDQFRRASLSICNNLAEGSRKKGKARKQFYNYALDSARECIPMVSLSFMQEQITNEQYDYLRNEFVQVCNMLYKLALSVKV